MGDGILAYFGYPQAHEEDAERAVRTGLELIEAAAKLDDGAGAALHMRVAIATGLLVVGDLRNEGVVQEHDGRPLPDLAGWGTVSILSVLAGIVVPGQGAGDRSPGFDGGFYVCDILRAARIMVRPVCDSPKTQERTMPIPNTQGTQPVPLFTPWLFVYLAVAMAASFVILLLALLIGLRQTDLPVLSWIYIGLGGIVADFVMRAWMGVRLVAWKTPQLPFIWVWLALVLLAAVVGPSAINDLLKSSAQH